METPLEDRPPRSRQWITGLLLVAAVAFGMVLAGSIELTSKANASNLPPQVLPVANVEAGATGLPSFADLAETVSPAVVSIRATSFESMPRGGGRVDPFEFFFGPRQRQQQQPQQQQPQEFRQDAGGSGFLVSPDGLVVTNHHVIEGARELRVTVGEREYKATVKGDDPETDIALLQLDSDETFRYLALGDSERLRVGDWIMVIGSPLNLDHTVTVGVVSAKDRSGLGLGRDISFENFIQTDAAINFGNSGGPLVNLRGEVVGIATAINYGAENIGFAVPVSTLEQVLPQLRDTGRVSRGYLGLDITNLDYDSAKAFGLDTPSGALVNSVREGTPAQKAGLQHGDVVIRADDQTVEDTHDLIDYVSGRGPGAKVELEVIRNGKKIKRTVELTERPGTDEPAAATDANSEGSIEWLGVEYQDLTPGSREAHGIPDGIEGIWITDVAQTSPLFEENVRPGMLITEVNGTATPDVASFEKAVEAVPSGEFLRLYVVTVDPRLDRPIGRFAFVRVP
ncbi:MAG: trypsin-like peptidase domain-containing protein [Acidobacteria bacterium]|nr:trypsin-like peptidase domain-containing protein [Acidobacteriota bacterium]